MACMVGSVTILVAMSSTGGLFFHRNPNNLVLPPQPGYGVGFVNGNPDGYGWVNPGVLLPLTADRTPDYFFPRYLALPATQQCLPNFYNPYISRGQRFIPYAGCGGLHPASGPPTATAVEAMHPYTETLNNQPRTAIPTFSGRVEAAPDTSTSTGLRP
jgi:hypothetical protein